MAEWVVAVATLSGVAVAIAACVVSYGQAIGWRPLLVVQRWGLIELYSGICAATVFEVWNRRRYPIVVRRLHVDYNKVRLGEIRDKITVGDSQSGWRTTFRGTLENREEFVIEPGQHKVFKVEAMCIQEGPFPDEEAKRITVKVLVFDPFWGKRTVLKGTGQIWWNSHPEFD